MKLLVAAFFLLSLNVCYCQSRSVDSIKVKNVNSTLTSEIYGQRVNNSKVTRTKREVSNTNSSTTSKNFAIFPIDTTRIIKPRKKN